MLKRWMSRALFLAVPFALGGCLHHGAGGGCCGGDHGAPAAPAAAYRCPHDGATRQAPGPCPTCGMALDERHRRP